LSDIFSNLLLAWRWWGCAFGTLFGVLLLVG
jgi:hypothetical protein